jgi:hypothetical protein
VTSAPEPAGKLKEVAEQIRNSLLLEADRAVLHMSEPNVYPIDAGPASGEQVFLEYLKTRKPEVHKAAIAKTNAALGTAERATRLGVLAKVDMKSSTSIDAQAARLLGWDHAASGDTLTRGPSGGPRSGAGSKPSTDDANAVVRCRLRSIVCVDETDPEFSDDDMLIGGAFINDKGATATIAQSRLGAFNTDEKSTREWTPAWYFHTSFLGWGVHGSLEASSWPKEYVAVIALCEEDNGGFPDWLGKLLDVIKGKIVQYVSAAAGAAIGAAIGTAAFPGFFTAIGAGIGALVGWVLGGIFDFFKSWWEDDPLPPITSTYTVGRYHDAPAVVTTDPYHYWTKGQGGEYHVELDWQACFPTHFADSIDSAVTWDNRKLYFFSGSQYVRYDLDSDQADEGYPKDIATNWPGLWKDGVRGGVLWDNGKAYFFKGDEYVRYDVKADKVDPGYPTKIATGWKGVWSSGIDAVLLNGVTGKAYFFKGDEYVRWDVKARRVDDGYPLKIGSHWPGTFSHDIDAIAVTGLSAYFFRGDSYIRYNLIPFDRADQGIARTAAYWPGL